MSARERAGIPERVAVAVTSLLMVRLKFATFAVAVLVVWVWHLYALAPTLGERAKAAASAQAARAPAGLAVKIDERRREFLRAALKVANAPAALSALRGRAEPPTAERLTPIQAAALEETPEPYRASLIVLLSNEHGVAYSRGGGAPIVSAQDLDASALVQAGAEGLWQEAFGSTHLFFSFPVAAFDRGEPKVIGNLVLGAPLQVEGLLDAAAKEAGLGAIALLRGGKVISVGGPEKPPLEKGGGSLGPGKTDVVVRGSLMKLGFFDFPLGTGGDAFGGKAPLWIGSRQAIRATPYEVIGYAATRPVMEPLAGYQRATVLLFFALLSLAVAMGVFIEGGVFRFAARRSAQEARPPAGLAMDDVRSAERGRTGPTRPGVTASSLADEPPPVPHAAIDAADGPAAANSAAHAALADLSPVGESPANAADGYGAFVDDNQPTTLYPSTFLGEDLSALSTQAKAEPAPSTAAEPYPDATRVQEMPEELIRASARLESEPAHPPKPAFGAPQSPPSDEQHFREVFRDFLATREKCGESAAGLTYDRFAVKLRKNRDQLIEKYNCRTVRFQVYVKEGKAALKAAPIKS